MRRLSTSALKVSAGRWTLDKCNHFEAKVELKERESWWEKKIVYSKARSLHIFVLT